MGPPPGFAPRPTHHPQAYLTGTGPGVDNHSLFGQVNQRRFPDSGETHHVTNSVDYLSESVTLPGTDQVLLGNGQGLPITSIGSAHFTSPYTTHTHLTLKNLLPISDITKKLISCH